MSDAASLNQPIASLIDPQRTVAQNAPARPRDTGALAPAQAHGAWDAFTSAASDAFNFGLTADVIDAFGVIPALRAQDNWQSVPDDMTNPLNAEAASYGIDWQGTTPSQLEYLVSRKRNQAAGAAYVAGYGKSAALGGFAGGFSDPLSIGLNLVSFGSFTGASSAAKAAMLSEATATLTSPTASAAAKLIAQRVLLNPTEAFSAAALQQAGSGVAKALPYLGRSAMHGAKEGFLNGALTMPLLMLSADAHRTEFTTADFADNMMQQTVMGAAFSPAVSVGRIALQKVTSRLAIDKALGNIRTSGTFDSMLKGVADTDPAFSALVQEHAWLNFAVQDPRAANDLPKILSTTKKLVAEHLERFRKADVATDYAAVEEIRKSLFAGVESDLGGIFAGLEHSNQRAVGAVGRAVGDIVSSDDILRHMPSAALARSALSEADYRRLSKDITRNVDNEVRRLLSKGELTKEQVSAFRASRRDVLMRAEAKKALRAKDGSLGEAHAVAAKEVASEAPAPAGSKAPVSDAVPPVHSADAVESVVDTFTPTEPSAPVPTEAPAPASSGGFDYKGSGLPPELSAHKAEVASRIYGAETDDFVRKYKKQHGKAPGKDSVSGFQKGRWVEEAKAWVSKHGGTKKLFFASEAGDLSAWRKRKGYSDSGTRHSPKESHFDSAARRVLAERDAFDGRPIVSPEKWTEMEATRREAEVARIAARLSKLHEGTDVVYTGLIGRGYAFLKDTLEYDDSLHQLVGLGNEKHFKAADECQRRVEMDRLYEASRDPLTGVEKGVHAMGARFGVAVRFVDGLDSYGVIDVAERGGRTGRQNARIIYLSPKANARDLVGTLIHEWVHSLTARDPGSYEALIRSLSRIRLLDPVAGEMQSLLHRGWRIASERYSHGSAKGGEMEWANLPAFRRLEEVTAYALQSLMYHDPMFLDRTISLLGDTKNVNPKMSQFAATAIDLVSRLTDAGVEAAHLAPIRLPDGGYSFYPKDTLLPDASRPVFKVLRDALNMEKSEFLKQVYSATEKGRVARINAAHTVLAQALGFNDFAAEIPRWSDEFRSSVNALSHADWLATRSWYEHTVEMAILDDDVDINKVDKAERLFSVTRPLFRQLLNDDRVPLSFSDGGVVTGASLDSLRAMGARLGLLDTDKLAGLYQEGLARSRLHGEEPPPEVPFKDTAHFAWRLGTMHQRAWVDSFVVEGSDGSVQRLSCVQHTPEGKGKAKTVYRLSVPNTKAGVTYSVRVSKQAGSRFHFNENGKYGARFGKGTLELGSEIVTEMARDNGVIPLYFDANGFPAAGPRPGGFVEFRVLTGDDIKSTPKKPGESGIRALDNMDDVDGDAFLPEDDPSGFSPDNYRDTTFSDTLARQLAYEVLRSAEKEPDVASFVDRHVAHRAELYARADELRDNIRRDARATGRVNPELVAELDKTIADAVNYSLLSGYDLPSDIVERAEAYVSEHHGMGSHYNKLHYVAELGRSARKEARRYGDSTSDGFAQSMWDTFMDSKTSGSSSKEIDVGWKHTFLVEIRSLLRYGKSLPKGPLRKALEDELWELTDGQIGRLYRQAQHFLNNADAFADSISVSADGKAVFNSGLSIDALNALHDAGIIDGEAMPYPVSMMRRGFGGSADSLNAKAMPVFEDNSRVAGSFNNEGFHAAAAEMGERLFGHDPDLGAEWMAAVRAAEESDLTGPAVISEVFRQFASQLDRRMQPTIAEKVIDEVAFNDNGAGVLFERARREFPGESSLMAVARLIDRDADRLQHSGGGDSGASLSRSPATEIAKQLNDIHLLDDEWLSSGRLQYSPFGSARTPADALDWLSERLAGGAGKGASVPHAFVRSDNAKAFADHVKAATRRALAGVSAGPAGTPVSAKDVVDAARLFLDNERARSNFLKAGDTASADALPSFDGMGKGLRAVAYDYLVPALKNGRVSVALATGRSIELRPVDFDRIPESTSGGVRARDEIRAGVIRYAANKDRVVGGKVTTDHLRGFLNELFVRAADNDAGASVAESLKARLTGHDDVKRFLSGRWKSGANEGRALNLETVLRSETARVMSSVELAMKDSLHRLNDPVFANEVASRCFDSSAKVSPEAATLADAITNARAHLAALSKQNGRFYAIADGHPGFDVVHKFEAILPNRAAWEAYMEKALDWDEMFLRAGGVDSKGRPFANVDVFRADYLDTLFAHQEDRFHLNEDPDAVRDTSSLARRAHHASLVWKTAEAAAEYDRVYGSGNPVAKAFRDVRRIAREVTAYGMVGPTPRATLGEVIATLPIDGYHKSVLTQTVDTLLGRGHQPESEALNNWSATLNAATDVALLGRGMLAQLADIPTMAGVLRYMGTGVRVASVEASMVAHMVQAFKVRNKGGDIANLLTAYGVAAESVQHTLNVELRKSGIHYGVQKLRNWEFGFNGVAGLQNNLQATHALMVARDLARLASSGAPFTPHEAQVFAQAGITQADMPALSKAIRRVDGYDHDIVDIRAIQDPRLALKVGAFVSDFSLQGVTTPDAMTRSTLQFGTRPGTVGRLAADLATKYTHVPLAVMARTHGRIFRGGRHASVLRSMLDFETGAASSLAAFVATSFVLGSVVYNMRRVSQGRKPVLMFSDSGDRDEQAKAMLAVFGNLLGGGQLLLAGGLPAPLPRAALDVLGGAKAIAFGRGAERTKDMAQGAAALGSMTPFFGPEVGRAARNAVMGGGTPPSWQGAAGGLLMGVPGVGLGLMATAGSGAFDFGDYNVGRSGPSVPAGRSDGKPGSFVPTHETNPLSVARPVEHPSEAIAAHRQASAYAFADAMHSVASIFDDHLSRVRESDVVFPDEPVVTSTGSVRSDKPVTFTNGRAILLNTSNMLDSATKSVRVIGYSLNHPQISGKLIDAHRRGVDVAVVLDREQFESDSGGMQREVLRLVHEGIPVRIMSPGVKGSLHSKVIVVDGEGIQTGSFNFTRRAVTSNEENAVYYRSAGDAFQYLQRFDSLYTVGQSLDGR